jgi:hypothetical protein
MHGAKYINWYYKICCVCEKKLNANPDTVMTERKPASRTSCSLCIRYTGRLFPLQESFIAVPEWKYNCLIGFTFLRKCPITKSRGRLGRNTCQPANWLRDWRNYTVIVCLCVRRQPATLYR